MAPALVLAASAANTAALVSAGAPTPRSAEKQRAHAVAGRSASRTSNSCRRTRCGGAVVQGTYAALSTGPDVAASFAGASKMLSSRLWPRGMPVEFERTWLAIRQKLLSLDAGFDVWVERYDNRLQGVPL